jgi:RNA polymerase sigma-70 factor (ECF subfamily)
MPSFQAISPRAGTALFDNKRPETAGRRPSEAATRASAARQEAALDAELVRRFNGGDGGAFEEIVARYRTKMFSVALSYLKNHADAEEVVQDTFIRAHRSLSRFRGDSSLATWLHRITVNLSHNRYWYFFRRHRHETQSLDSPLNERTGATFADLVPTSEPNPAREMANREFAALVAACMTRLSAPQHEILTRRDMLNHPYKDIAQDLGLNLGTVKSRIARARENLRALLGLSYPEVAAADSTYDWFESFRQSGHLDGITA